MPRFQTVNVTYSVSLPFLQHIHHIYVTGDTFMTIIIVGARPVELEFVLGSRFQNKDI